ncbi:MAG: hypothetical protein JST05_09260 [Acidobacteria bacterium]|nr:hypothetical protein [Acidobacteriota bacterium]
MRPALLLLTSSRSGSSALTGVMSMLGASLPKALLGAGPGNVRGHFEPARLIAINDEVLAAHGATYLDPIMIPDAWFEGSEAKAFVQRIAATIAEEYGDADLPIIKDPRICRVAPLYLKALDQLGYTPLAVIPLRHPGEVTASLSHRDGTAGETAELLNLCELLGGELYSRGLRRIWTRYDELLLDWRSTMSRMAAKLGFEWPVPMDSAAASIEAFLSPSLRHFDAPAAHEVGRLATRLWDASLAGMAGDENGARAGFDAVREISGELNRLSSPWQSALLLKAARTHEDLVAQKRVIKHMRATASWKVTAPFRMLGRLLGMRPIGGR